MYFTQKLFQALLFVALSPGLISISCAAPPVRNKVLEEVLVIEKNGQPVIEVQFSFPLRYLSHFPQKRGGELHIRLRPVRIPASDLDAAFKREGVVPEYAEAAAVGDVIYEGDAEGGPYLTVIFTRPVTYEVIPGSDYRSMRIIILPLDQGL